MKWYGRYGRKAGWIVKNMENMEEKASRIVKRYEKYGRKVS